MSNSDEPAGGTGGSTTAPTPDLPERMRVHALAKLIGRTSRDVLAVLADLGATVKSAQSSVDRAVAEQVVAALDAPADDTPAAVEVPPVAEPAPGRAAALAPPTPLFQPPAPPRRRRRGATEAAAAVEEQTPAAADGETEAAEPAADPAPEPATTGRRRGRSRRGAAETAPEAAPETAPEAASEVAPEVAPEVVGEPATEAAEEPDATDEPGDDSGDDAGRRRRRRGRRGRGRGRGGDDATDESDDDADHSDGAADSDDDEAEDSADTDTADTDTAGTDSADDAENADDGEGSDGASRRRRRRRRRRGAADDTAADDDPPGTVTKVRAPREARDDTDDGVQSVRGSTRLEAKRQRRRDGRDAGRRRTPVLSESEFLARREAVERTMVVREHGDRVEIAVLEDGVLVEHFVAGTGRDGSRSLVGNVYLGRVQNVLPSMEAAFVDIGRGRNAVLYAGEVDWDAAGLNGKARKIEQALSSGDQVLVQVTKDPVGHKGARLTTQISLAGRFLVYVPSGGAAGISRKLPDVERKRLKDMLKEIVPSEAGVIIRTASEGVGHDALERDVRRLQAQWEVVKAKSEATGPNKPKAPTLLYEEPDLIVKVVRDQFNEDFSTLVVEGDDAWDTVSGYISHVAPELVERLRRHTGTADVFAAHRIDEQLLKALDRKVWLPSGGTLVIDRTEAMTVVDVNTGKFTGSGGNLEETVTRNNLEAAEEIVRQLRLRDIGGIIVVDFIDMVLEANRDLVLRRLTECLARDRTRHQVAEVTSLGLVQMTRKRVGGGLLEHFSVPCEHCRGRGILVSAEPVTERPQRDGDDRNGGDRNGGDRNGGDRNGGRRGRGGRGRRDDNGHAGASNGATAQEQSAQEQSAQERSVRDEPAAAVPARNGHVSVAEPEPVAASAPSAPSMSPEAVSPEPGSPEPAPEPVAAPVGATDGSGPDGGGPAPRSRRRGRVTRDAGAPGAVAPEVATAPAEPAPADIAVTANGAAAPVPEPEPRPANGVTAPGLEPESQAVSELEAEPRPRRRGRVTRTAGAPTATAGAEPVVGVVTVPVRDEAEPALVPVVAQPEPAPVVSRPRRARRAASRPAGPPVGEETDPA